MGRLKLLITTISTTAFLLSIWGMPLLILWLGFGYFENWWIKTGCSFFAALWFALIRPWAIFRGQKWHEFLSIFLLAIRRIFFLD